MLIGGRLAVAKIPEPEVNNGRRGHNGEVVKLNWIDTKIIGIR